MSSNVNAETRREYYLRGMRRAAHEIQRMFARGYRRPREIANIIDAIAVEELGSVRGLDRVPIEDTALCPPIDVRPWGEIRNEVLSIDQGKCVNCGSSENLEIHHRDFVSKGGLPIPENLITLCVSCHKQHPRPHAAKVTLETRVGPQFDKNAAAGFNGAVKRDWTPKAALKIIPFKNRGGSVSWRVTGTLPSGRVQRNFEDKATAETFVAEQTPTLTKPLPVRTHLSPLMVCRAEREPWSA